MRRCGNNFTRPSQLEAITSGSPKGIYSLLARAVAFYMVLVDIFFSSIGRRFFGVAHGGMSICIWRDGG